MFRATTSGYKNKPWDISMGITVENYSGMEDTGRDTVLGQGRDIYYPGPSPSRCHTKYTSIATFCFPFFFPWTAIICT